MSERSRIEWTDGTWNPVTGCTRVSEGCRHCYAERMARRLKAMGQPRYAHGFRVTLHSDLVEVPKRWKKPRRIFVCSMSDLFHEKVSTEFIRRVFDTMQSCPQHTFQVLTKRSKRLRELAPDLPWPYHIWIGVSVEDKRALPRVADLRAVPAQVRFLSCEPLLGPITLDRGWLTGTRGKPKCHPPISWVIVGGESGPKARPMHPDWVRSLRDQSEAAKVPFFFKQWGEYAPGVPYYSDGTDRDRALDRPHVLVTPAGEYWDSREDGQPPPVTWVMHRVGKAKAGRMLDGREWDELPGRGEA